MNTQDNGRNARHVGRSFEVPLRSTWRADDAPPPLPREPVPAAKPQEHPEWSDEPEPCRPRVKPADEQKRPLWKNPVALAGAGVSCLLMMVFLGYLYVNHAEKAFEGRVTHLKIEADDLARSGESRTAVEKYDNLLAMIEQKRFGAGRYRRIVASATTSRNRLLAVVEAQEEAQAPRRQRGQCEDSS